MKSQEYGLLITKLIGQNSKNFHLKIFSSLNTLSYANYYIGSFLIHGLVLSFNITHMKLRFSRFQFSPRFKVSAQTFLRVCLSVNYYSFVKITNSVMSLSTTFSRVSGKTKQTDLFTNTEYQKLEPCEVDEIKYCFVQLNVRRLMKNSEFVCR